MKFSHALLVVLALHIIAVGGVFAFNSIKAGQAAAAKNAAKEEIARAVARTSTPPKPSAPDNVVEGWQGRTHTVQAGDTLSRLASLYKTTIEAIENENGITTYSMIRVGQVLKIPAAKTETTKPATDPASAAAKHAFLATKSDLPKAPVTPTIKAETPKAPVPRLPKRKLPSLRQLRRPKRKLPSLRQLRRPKRKLPNRPPPRRYLPSLWPNQPIRRRRKFLRRPPTATPTPSPRVTTPTASPRNCT